MTKQELIDIIDSWENLPFVIGEICSNSNYYEMLIDIAFYSNYSKSWRAAYIVDKINDDFPELLLPYLEKMILQLEEEKSSSKKRHFLKLISMKSVPEKYFGFLVEYCLEALSSAKEPPAVRVHAMQILYNISETEPGLKPEILVVIEHEMEFHSTAGILSRGRKLTEKLRKEIQ